MILLKFPTPAGHHLAMVLLCLSLYIMMDNILTTVTHRHWNYGQIHVSVSRGMGSAAQSHLTLRMSAFKLKARHFVNTSEIGMVLALQQYTQVTPQVLDLLHLNFISQEHSTAKVIQKSTNKTRGKVLMQEIINKSINLK